MELIDDWKEIANSNGFNRAAGDWLKWLGELIGGAGEILTPKDGGLTAAQIAEQKRLADIEAAKQKASNTFMYIILAVVVLVIVKEKQIFDFYMLCSHKVVQNQYISDNCHLQTENKNQHT